MFNPGGRGRGGAGKQRQKRKWEMEMERGSESPPASSHPQRSDDDDYNKATVPAAIANTTAGDSGAAQRGDVVGEERSARNVFGGSSSYHTAGATQQTQGRNCFVFLDIEVGGTHVRRMSPAGRLEIELFAKDCPKTAENFRQLCLGTSGPGQKTGYPLSYADCPMHRIIPGFMAQGGDFQRGDGTGGESIYGGDFEDENFLHRHTTRGLLSMANSGRHTNGSQGAVVADYAPAGGQFFLTLGRATHLDGKHCVFGRVVGGFRALDKMEAVGTRSGDPKERVVISACGELSEDTPNKLEKEQHSGKHRKRGRDTQGHSPGGRTSRERWSPSRSRSQNSSRERR